VVGFKLIAGHKTICLLSQVIIPARSGQHSFLEGAGKATATAFCTRFGRDAYNAIRQMSQSERSVNRMENWFALKIEPKKEQSCDLQ